MEEPVFLPFLASRSCQHSLVCGPLHAAPDPAILHLPKFSSFIHSHIPVSDHSWGKFSVLKILLISLAYLDNPGYSISASLTMSCRGS